MTEFPEKLIARIDGALSALKKGGEEETARAIVEITKGEFKGRVHWQLVAAVLEGTTVALSQIPEAERDPKDRLRALRWSVLNYLNTLDRAEMSDECRQLLQAIGYRSRGVVAAQRRLMECLKLPAWPIPGMPTGPMPGECAQQESDFAQEMHELNILIDAFYDKDCDK